MEKYDLRQRLESVGNGLEMVATAATYIGIGLIFYAGLAVYSLANKEARDGLMSVIDSVFRESESSQSF